MHTQSPLNFALLFLFIFMTTQIGRAAIVNIEDLRPDGGEVGSSGKLDLTFSRSQGNTNVMALQAQNAFAWSRERSESLFILNYRYGESGDEVNANQGLGHLRHAQELTEQGAIEVFVQAQKDEFKRLTYRLLSGAGYRFRALFTDRTRLFLGLGGFYSHERLAATTGTYSTQENAFRINSYASYRFAWTDAATLASTVYYQPRADRTEDFHILWDNSLRVKLIKTLQLKMSYELLYDSRSPREVVGTDQRYFTGLSWNY